jgi:urease beta subunit
MFGGRTKDGLSDEVYVLNEGKTPVSVLSLIHFEFVVSSLCHQRRKKQIINILKLF